MRKAVKASLIIGIIFVSTTLGSPKHKMVAAGETFRLRSDPIVVTRDDQAIAFRVVEVGTETVVGYYSNGESKTFDRADINIINEIKLDHVPFAVFGGLIFGAAGVMMRPDEEDPLANRTLWGGFYAAIGAGLGYTFAITTSGLYTYYFNEELYSKYAIDL
ncbi:MAG: hypothetical protein HN995_07240 [Candidatus Marinimicrobia bacterium]|nr:hypothetical protein [Candidatus Neomarinimicrobiota bacterium]MBT3823753.1 hypothetical protein [Candidatus Neomarinimicrobiota bacterium]MBT4034541.1 hypothetical protein [Candidatus Neomarinimicrobiota bacterium]MBT4360420.1 hypothetical protein [Candidatus Neomarinimicrobiota bacterium]MBT4419447.1 hypothetical protein [Candidatus Neomarinimicrobiota bacterium]